MKILILGSKGQLGKIINNKLLKKKNFIVKSLSRKNFDLTNNIKLTKYINQINPDVIINCVAYTDVENAEINKKKCFLINSKFISILSDLCIKNNCFLIHFSTDYVFNGKKGNYKESNKVSSINYYGYTKILGEKIIKKKLKKYIIIRTSWLYSNTKNNFFTKIITKIKNKDNIQVVNDQFGFPTSCYDLAKVTIKLITKFKNNNKIKTGVYHYSNYGIKEISWFDFAKKINYFYYKKTNNFSKIISVSSKNFKTLAKRPVNSSLNIDKICNTFNIKKKKWDMELKRIIRSERI